MPSEKSAERIKAEQMFYEHKGNIKLVEIAEHLGILPSKVRKWKSLDKWDDKLSPPSPNNKKKQGERSTKGKGNAPPANAPKEKKSRGAPKGNTNAVGNEGGAPIGNNNAEKHGGYSAVYWDTLDETEKEMLKGVPTDEEQLLIEQIQLFAIRERRIMQAINKYKNARGGLAVSGVTSSHTKRKFTSDEEKTKYEELRKEKIEEEKISYLGYDEFTQTSTEATISIMQRLENELTRIQRAKTQCIAELNKLHSENRKFEEDSKGNELVDDWISGVIGGDDNE